MDVILVPFIRGAELNAAERDVKATQCGALLTSTGNVIFSADNKRDLATNHVVALRRRVDRLRADDTCAWHSKVEVATGSE